jgi:ArsR family transcriptional regulator
MSKEDKYDIIGSLLRVLGHPTRIRILLEIGIGEVCVCHLEAQLGIRQAYLSQQLMALREEGILRTNREGRFIYYRIADQKILDLITAAAQIKGVSLDAANAEKKTCDCPKCCSES